MFINTHHTADIVAAILELDIREQDILLLLVAESEGMDMPALIKALNAAGLRFVGGLFPGVIHNSRYHRRGVVVKKLQAIAPPVLVQGLNQPDFAWPALSSWVEQAQRPVTAWIMIDGLTAHISHFLAGLYDQLGERVNFIGAGAGSLSLQQKPCLFSPEGLFQDAAIICLLDYKARLGVKHGWKRLAGPIVATRTEKNRIYELNWEMAFDVYQRYIEADAGCRLEAGNFFEIAKAYPFGISKSNAEEIVRDPIAVAEDGALVCVGEVPENTVLNILKGDADSLIDAAAEAVEQTLCPTVDQQKVRHTLVVDCISRALYLENRLEEELEQVCQRVKAVRDEVSPQGVLSLGEISSYGDGYLEFFNKTIVVGSLY